MLNFMENPPPARGQRLAVIGAQMVVMARKAGVLLGRGLKIAAHYTRIGAQATWVVLQRAPIAIYSLIRALSSDEYAEALRTLQVEGLPTAYRGGRGLQPAALQEAPPDSALVLLSLLQKEGRFIDFLQEDIQNYSDQEIGSAARVVHQGCQRVLREHIRIEPVRTEGEGSLITLERGFDPAEIRPTGHVVGDPPFRGALVHRGWRAAEVRLPQVANSRDVRILAAAEVEL